MIQGSARSFLNQDGKWQLLNVPTLLWSFYFCGGVGNVNLSNLQFDRSDLGAESSDLQTEVTELSFNADSGFEAQDLGDGEVFIKLNSTFNPTKVDGEEAPANGNLDVSSRPGQGGEFGQATTRLATGLSKNEFRFNGATVLAKY